MAIKHYILLCIVLTSSFFILSDALPTTQNLFHRLQKRSGIRLCGKYLVEALAAICDSEYYAPSIIKRKYEYDLDWESNSKGVLEPQRSYELFDVNSLSRRGVADECCIKSCTIKQLISYCSTSQEINFSI